MLAWKSGKADSSSKAEPLDLLDRFHPSEPVTLERLGASVSEKGSKPLPSGPESTSPPKPKDCAQTEGDNAPSAPPSVEYRESAGGTLAVFETSAIEMEAVAENRLPEGAKHTLDLINSGRRYPGFRNNIVFHNKEKQLPARPDGYYKEWTVRTKGKTGRGKSRLVSGQNGELFFTMNHYKSFRWVVPAKLSPTG